MLVIVKKTRPAKVQARIDNFFDRKVKFIANEEYEQRDADRKILVPFPDKKAFEEARIKTKQLAPVNMPPILRPTYEEPLLSFKQEVHLFKKMNYLKCKAVALREGEHRDFPDWGKIFKFENYLKQSSEARNQLTNSNLRLAVGIAKKFFHPSLTEEDMLNEAYHSVWHAVDKYDVSLGNKFSTYCTWVIKNCLIRLCEVETTVQSRYVSGTKHSESEYEEDFALSLDRKAVYEKVVKAIAELEKNPIYAHQIMALRHHVGLGTEAKTLKEAGTLMGGITKERVRQLEFCAIDKIQQIFYQSTTAKTTKALEKLGIRSEPVELSRSKRRRLSKELNI